MRVEAPTCMKTWNGPTFIKDILPKTLASKNPYESWMFDISVEFHSFGGKLILEHEKNGFGYETLASGLQYPIRIVVRVCWLAISTNKTTRFNSAR
jgi:hypothetical protein